MPQGTDYIFALQDNNYNFWQVEADGTVSKSTRPYFLKFSPVGWDETAIQNVRNKKYWGIDRSVTAPLSYVEDGARILKHIMYTFGSDAEVYLVIAAQELEYIPGVHYFYWYRKIFRGQIDFSTFIHTGAKVQCNTIESGFPKHLKSNESTVYEFPVNDPEAIDVKMDGVVLRNRVDNVVTNGLGGTDINYEFGNHLIDLTITMEDAPYVGGKKEVRRVKDINNATDAIVSGGWFLNTSTNGQVEFEWDFKVKFDYLPSNEAPNPSAEYAIIIGRRQFGASGFADSTPLLHIPNTDGPNRFRQTIHLQGSAVVDAGAGDEFYLMAFCTVVGAQGSAQTQVVYLPEEVSFFNYSYKSRAPETFVKAFRPQTLFGRLIEKVTEGEFTADVSPFFAEHFDKPITCGDAIRGIEGAVLKLSFNDFFEFWDSFDSVGIYPKPGNRIGFDRKENMVDRSAAIDLPLVAVDSFKVSVAKDYLFNEWETGSPDLNNDVGVLNGKQEFNTKMLFSLGTTISPAKVNKVPKIKTSCYEIEKIRIEMMGKDTTDSKEDNDNFILHIHDTLIPGTGGQIDHYGLDRTLNASATGIIEQDSVFNIIFSPKRNILRNGSYINSCNFKGLSKLLAYKSADRNNELVADGVVEKADVSLSELDAPFFVPLVGDGEFPTPTNLLEMLDLNPLQVVRFVVRGEEFEAIIVKIGIAPSKRDKQPCQLMFTPHNDFEKLIEYYG